MVWFLSVCLCVLYFVPKVDEAQIGRTVKVTRHAAPTDAASAPVGPSVGGPLHFLQKSLNATLLATRKRVGLL